MSKSSAIIVGVGVEQGLGGALSRRFAAEGYHVIVAGRTLGKIEKVAGAIVASGGNAEAVETDATNEDAVVRLFENAFARRDGIDPPDLIVFNAGINRNIAFRDISAKQFEEFWRICCFGGFLVGREAARHLAPLGRGDLHRRFSKPSRQGRICPIRIGEGRIADDKPKYGAGIGAAWHSCGPYDHRWRHRRRTTSSLATRRDRCERRERPASHRCHRRQLLAHPPTTSIRLDAGARPAPIQGKLLNSQPTWGVRLQSLSGAGMNRPAAEHSTVALGAKGIRNIS